MDFLQRRGTVRVGFAPMLRRSGLWVGGSGSAACPGVVLACWPASVQPLVSCGLLPFLVVANVMARRGMQDSRTCVRTAVACGMPASRKVDHEAVGETESDHLVVSILTSTSLFIKLQLVTDHTHRFFFILLGEKNYQIKIRLLGVGCLGSWDSMNASRKVYRPTT